MQRWVSVANQRSTWVEPRGRGRREVHMKARMTGEGYKRHHAMETYVADVRRHAGDLESGSAAHWVAIACVPALLNRAVGMLSLASRPVRTGNLGGEPRFGCHLRSFRGSMAQNFAVVPVRR
jgi:hypothetical protein